MAYPFAPLPTFAQFITRLCGKEFECTFETIPAPMVVDGDENDCVAIHFLQRIMDDRKLTYAFYQDDFDAIMEWDTVRSMCDRLEIPREAFGLTLG
jgi:hypothetical protein